MTETTMDFDFDASEGAEAAREAFKNSGVNFDRLDFFSLDASPGGVANGDDQCIVRFLSDHIRLPGQDLTPWITVEQHSMVPTKPKPSNLKEGSSWPSKMGCCCRNGKVFKNKYGDCYVCTMRKPDGASYKASNRTWSLGCLREEVFGDGTPELGGPERKGQVVGIRDMTKQVVITDKDGKPTEESKTVKRYVKMNLGWKNFFGPMAGFAGRYQTVLDRDYHIRREGMGASDTLYHPVPLDPIQLPGGGVYDMRNEALRKQHHPDMPDLRAVVSEQASDEFFQRFFVPGEAPAAGTPPTAKTADGPAVVPNAPSSEAPQDRLNALKGRITGASEPAPAVAAAPVAAAPVAAPVATTPVAADPAPAPMGNLAL